MFLASVRNLEEYFDIPVYRSSSKEATSLNLFFIYPKDKIPSQLKQNIVYKWSCYEENCNLSYIEESSRCLENRIKEHNSHRTSAIYKHSISNHHP